MWCVRKVVPNNNIVSSVGAWLVTNVFIRNEILQLMKMVMSVKALHASFVIVNSSCGPTTPSSKKQMLNKKPF